MLREHDVPPTQIAQLSAHKNTKSKENYYSVSTKRQMHIYKVLSSVLTIPVLRLHLKQPVYLSLSLTSPFFFSFFLLTSLLIGFIMMVLLASHFQSNEKPVFFSRQYFYSSAKLPPWKHSVRNKPTGL